MFGFLDEFRDSNGFPAGSFDMKEFRINPLSSEFWDAVASGATVDQKKASIADINAYQTPSTFSLTKSPLLP